MGSYLRSVQPDIVNLGVFTAPGDRVEGRLDTLRGAERMTTIVLDLRHAADFAT